MICLITIIASIIFGLSNLYIIPILLPICLAWMFYAADRNLKVWKVSVLSVLFSGISSFISDYPLMESFQHQFSSMKYQSAVLYALTTFMQAAPLAIGLIAAFVFNKYFVSRKLVRHLNYAVFTYFASAIFPNILGWKMSYSLIKYKIPFIQFADWVGFSGLDLVMLILASTLVSIASNRNLRMEKVLSLIIVMTLITLGGVFKKGRYNKADVVLNTLSVQTSLPPTRNFFKLENPNLAVAMQINFIIIKESLNTSHDLIIFPESELPFSYNDPKAGVASNQFSALVYQTQVPVISGTYFLDKDNYYNSSVFIHKDGKLDGFQHAKTLIPIVEKQKNIIDLRSFTNTMSNVYLTENHEVNKPYVLQKDKHDIKILALSNSDSLSSSNNLFDFNPDFLIGMSNDELLRTSSLMMEKYNWAVLSKALELRRPMIHSSHFGPNTAITSSGVYFGSTASGDSTALNTSLNVKLDQMPTIYTQIQKYLPYIIFFGWIVFALISSMTYHSRPEAYFEN